MRLSGTTTVQAQGAVGPSGLLGWLVHLAAGLWLPTGARAVRGREMGVLVERALNDVLVILLELLELRCLLICIWRAVNQEEREATLETKP